MSMETPDKLAEKIRAAREVSRLATRFDDARAAERAERDIQVAREFATTARLARVMAESA